MAYGNVIDYEPGPAPGSYNFATRDGKKLTLTGPSAEDLKKKLDASNAYLPQKTAGLEPTAPLESRADVGPTMSASPPRVAPEFAPPAAQLSSPNPGPRPPAPAPQAPPKEPGPPQARFVPYMSTAGGDTIALREGGDPSNPMDLVVQTRARSGSKGGPVERARTVVDGYDRDPEYEEKRDAIYGDMQISNDAARLAAADQIAAERALIEERQKDILAQAEEARFTKQQVDTGVKQLSEKRAKAVKEYSGSKVDPKRYLAGGKNWLAGIANAMGSIGAARIGAPGFAMNALESRIAQDIGAQEKEIAVKGEAADNALADLTREMGSADLAKNTLASIQREGVKLQLDMMASSTKDKEQQAYYSNIGNQLSLKQLEDQHAYIQGANGHVTRSIVMTQGSAGSAGGQRAVTAGEFEGASKGAPKTAEGGRPPPPLASERTEKLSSWADAISAADEAEGLLGDQDSNWGDPTGGPWDSTVPDAGRAKLRSVTARLAKGAQASRGKSDKDAELAEVDVMGGGSVNERKAGAAKVKEAAVQAIVTEIATLPTNQQAQVLQSLPEKVRLQVAAKMGGR